MMQTIKQMSSCGMHGILRIFFFWGFVCTYVVYGMEPKNDGSSAVVVAQDSTAFYDAEILNKCETFEHVTSFLVDQERTSFNEIKEHYKIPDDVWHAEVTHRIEAFKQLAKKHYSTPSFFPPRRDPLVPKEVVEVTEQMLKRHNMDPTCFDIIYDQKYFGKQSASAFARSPGYSFILERPSLWGNGVISYNLGSSIDYSQRKLTVAHEVIHVRDVHGIQKRLVEYAVVKQMGLSSLFWYCYSVKDVYSQPAYKKLRKVHETMADLLPLLECAESIKMIDEHFYFYRRFIPKDNDGFHPRRDETCPILNKISAIAGNNAD